LNSKKRPDVESDRRFFWRAFSGAVVSYRRSAAAERSVHLIFLFPRLRQHVAAVFALSKVLRAPIREKPRKVSMAIFWRQDAEQAACAYSRGNFLDRASAAFKSRNERGVRAGVCSRIAVAWLSFTDGNGVCEFRARDCGIKDRIHSLIHSHRFLLLHGTSLQTTEPSRASHPYLRFLGKITLFPFLVNPPGTISNSVRDNSISTKIHWNFIHYVINAIKYRHRERLSPLSVWA
jgi:hypothetical protein